MRRALDRVELLALTALAGLSLVVLAALPTKGRPLSGADGLLAADQLQYFAWIRESAHHVLIGNRFDLAPGPRSFLHPGFAISGGLNALGLSVPLSYLVWKPVAVGLTFYGALRYVRRLLDGRGARHAALILTLFAVMPASWIVAWTNWGGNPRQFTFDFISGEMWSGQYLWGYLMTAIAVFLMPLVLLGLERGAGPGPRRRRAAGLLAAAVAGRDAGADRPRRRAVAAQPPPRACGGGARDRPAGPLLPAARPASTAPGSWPRSRTPRAPCRSGAGRGGPSC